MSLPFMLPPSVCVRERGRGAERERRERGGMIIGARSYELCCRTLHGNTHTRTCIHAFKWKLHLGYLSSASTVSIREGNNGIVWHLYFVIVWYLYFERPFTLFPHFFPALSVKRCPFPSVLIRCQVSVLADAARGKLGSVGQTRPQVALSGIQPSQIGVIW